MRKTRVIVRRAYAVTVGVGVGAASCLLLLFPFYIIRYLLYSYKDFKKKYDPCISVFTYDVCKEGRTLD